MINHNQRINQLLHQLDVLTKKQEDFSREINHLRTEINQLKATEDTFTPKVEEITIEPVVIESNREVLETFYNDDLLDIQSQQQKTESPIPPYVPKQSKSDWERFIGENLINKIGIAITVIGVAIGAKYSIENDLISPLTRIILGYLCGLGLLGFGIKLKAKYENYSAVLVSGAMTIMYFITYMAYALYQLVPQVMAFLLMLVFTVFTVVAALHYNRQVIAHIGLVGAYAVPFLLSTGSGNVAVLFTYMVIINIGILILAFKKYWKPLNYVSFGLTWVIFSSWFIAKYHTDYHFVLALVFLSLFFVIFYLAFLAYKVIRKEVFVLEDIILVMLNSFVFYALGYAILRGHQTGAQLLGVFTLLNAIIHFAVSVVIHKQKLADKNVQHLVAGLVLIFVTIAIPVQLDGNWVTLMWAGEAALLFWIGRSKQVLFYEVLAYPLMLLAFFSIIQDWSMVYNRYKPGFSELKMTAIFNVNFLSSVLFIAAFTSINVCNRKKKTLLPVDAYGDVIKVIHYAIPAILLLVIYFAFRMEIASYWHQVYADSLISIPTEDPEYSDVIWNEDLAFFKVIWLINYALLFFTILSFVNLRKFKNEQLGWVNLVVNVITLLAFLTQGLYYLSELRESYFNPIAATYYHKGSINVWLRYVSFALVAFMLYACYQYVKQMYTQRHFKITFELVLHSAILWIASSELINWMDIYKSEQSYKLGLSILWGLYALFLIAYGIWKKNKPLRIGAIVLFGFTLIKLFFYDIAHLNTIAKTIVFVSLGVLLLIISFLYNKYKHIIADEEHTA